MQKSRPDIKGEWEFGQNCREKRAVMSKAVLHLICATPS